MTTKAKESRVSQKGRKTGGVVAKKDRYILRLYVAGTTLQSMRAVSNIKNVCEEHLAGSYDLEVVDLYQQPHLAEGEQIIAVPTLIKKLPLPLRRIIGDMSDTERVLIGLDLKQKKNPTSE